MQWAWPSAALLTLTACAPALPPTTEIRCPAWIEAVAPISSSSADTERTRGLIDALNLAGEEQGCWAPPGEGENREENAPLRQDEQTDQR